MASKVASSSHTGPTHGWDDDSPAGIELEVPKSYTSSRRSRSSRPPPTYVGQESDENDAALIGTDGGQVWCSSAVVQENAPELARYLVQNSHGQTSAKRRIKMPMNTEQLSLLVAALEPTTCAKIPWGIMPLEDLINVTSMLLTYKVFLWCHGTMEQSFIDLVRHQSVEDCGRYGDSDTSSSRIFNIAHTAGFSQLMALCLKNNPSYASSRHLLHEGDDRPRKRVSYSRK